MGVFEMVVLIVFITTVGKIMQSRRPRGVDASLVKERIQALEAELRASELRLAQTEERVADLDEKLDFMEKLLAKPADHPGLARPEREPQG